jgi:hypothetical protein
MTSLRRVSFVAASALAAALLSTAPSTAKDHPAPAACQSAYQDGLTRQQANHPRDARAAFVLCAKPSCGSLQRKCASAAEQVRSAIAWIAPVVTDAEGTPLADVRVKIDDQLLTAHLDGRELPVDPGLHEVSATARVGAWPGREVSATRKVMIVEGQRGPLAISLPAPDSAPAETASAAAPAPASASASASDSAEPSSQAESAPVDPAPAPAKHHGTTAWPFVIGGVGLAGLGAGALLTYWGRSDNAALSSCSPNCAPSSVDHIHTLYLAADISFGVGGAALGAAALLFVLSHPSSHEGTPTTTAFDVQPTRSGAVASFQGVF